VNTEQSNSVVDQGVPAVRNDAPCITGLLDTDTHGRSTVSTAFTAQIYVL